MKKTITLTMIAIFVFSLVPLAFAQNSSPGFLRDRLEDVRDAKEDVRDAREDVKDRREDIRDVSNKDRHPNLNQGDLNKLRALGVARLKDMAEKDAEKFKAQLAAIKVVKIKNT